MEPKLCQVVTEFVILHKQVELGSGVVGNINHEIALGHDGSVYLKEVLVTAARDVTLHDSISYTFDDFSKKFPGDANIIRDFVNRKMLTIPGMDKRCDL